MFSNNERLKIIAETVSTIQNRIKQIEKPEDFISNENNLILLDSVCIRLQTIGENFNKIIKSQPEIIEMLSIDVTPIINFRNIISHEYELLDYQVIYNICKQNLPELQEKILNFLSNRK